MAKQLNIRCPDNLYDQIERKARDAGQDKTKIVLGLLEGLPSIPIEERRDLPCERAVYLIWAGERLLSFGQTANLNQRIRSHPKLVQFLDDEARISWFESWNVNQEGFETDADIEGSTNIGSDLAARVEALEAAIEVISPRDLPHEDYLTFAQFKKLLDLPGDTRAAKAMRSRPNVENAYSYLQEQGLEDWDYISSPPRFYRKGGRYDSM